MKMYIFLENTLLDLSKNSVGCWTDAFNVNDGMMSEKHITIYFSKLS